MWNVLGLILYLFCEKQIMEIIPRPQRGQCLADEICIKSYLVYKGAKYYRKHLSFLIDY